jgi:hypothetical protein
LEIWLRKIGGLSLLSSSFSQISSRAVEMMAIEVLLLLPLLSYWLATMIHIATLTYLIG